MTLFEAGSPLTRRRALKMGAGIAGSLLAATSLSTKTAFADSDDYGQGTVPSPNAQTQISNILQAEGQVQDGIFQIEIDREDIDNVTLHGVPIKPSFQINGTACFQSLGNGQTMLNGDMALRPSELDGFIGALVENNIEFQAEHQHMYDFSPIVWFVHYRAVGDDDDLARRLKAALDKTSTPFPQTLPTNPTTPLPAQQMGQIIGAKPQIGADGVVTFNVPRRKPCG